MESDKIAFDKTSSHNNTSAICKASLFGVLPLVDPTWEQVRLLGM